MAREVSRLGARRAEFRLIVVGYGDELMATGIARGAKARGKRIAFGDGQKIIWSYLSEQIFKDNPNIAPLGSENDPDIEWHPFCRGNRIYNRQVGNRWEWNYEFRPIPGEVFFTPEELEFGAQFGSGFVVIETNVMQKGFSPNKQWPIIRYNKVARLLQKDGAEVVQFVFNGGYVLPNVRQIRTPTFRHAMAVLKYAALYIGPEGGLHHASAAVGAGAVVLFGGFIPPRVTGYDAHTNLTGSDVFCGSLQTCSHCKTAMETISVPDVMDAAHQYLKVAA